MNNEKLLALLGFAIKSGNVAKGLNACEQSLKRNKGKLLLFSDDLSENSKKTLCKNALKINVPYRIFSEPTIFQDIIKNKEVKCFLILEANFAKQMLKLIDETIPK